MPLKVMTIVGTRPELIKLSRVIAELDRRLSHVLVHTGQNYDYGLNQVFFEQLGIRRPDHFLGCAAPGAARTIANVIAGADRVIAREKPDAVLVLGDTNSALSVIAAKRRRVPVFHMEAGNRCFDERVPEEINRRLVDHASDVNLPYTEHARRYLLAEGIRPETVIRTGSPMREVLEHYGPAIRRSRVLRALKLAPSRYIVASAHREENVDEPARLRALIACLEAAGRRLRKKVVFSTHPRTRARLSALRARRGPGTPITFLEPLGFLDYVKLQTCAYCVLSDSGTLTEEAAILGFPAVMLRQAHERPEGMDEAAVLMTELEPQRTLDAIGLAVAHAREGRACPPVADYAARDVSRKVVRIILSYTDYVNRTVWRK